MCSRSYITMLSLVGLDFHPPPEWPETLSFLPAALRAAQRAGIKFTHRPILRFFAPQRRHVAPMGVKFGMEEGTLSLLHAKFHPHRCNDNGVGPQKLKFLLKFDQNVEYKLPAGAYPLQDFHKICRVCTSFQDALGVNIFVGFAQGVMELWGF